MIDPKTALKGISAFSLVAGSVGIRMLYASPLSRLATSIGIGMGIQFFINTCVDDKYKSRVQQVALTLFGQFSFYAAAQIWDNFSNPDVQRGSMEAIGVMAGVTAGAYIKTIWDRKFLIRNESSKTVSRGNEPKFEGIFIPQWIDCIKVAAAVGFAVCWFFYFSIRRFC